MLQAFRHRRLTWKNRLLTNANRMTHAEIHFKAYQAVTVLEHRAKLAAQEHRERIKRLRGLMHAISVQQARDGLNMLDDSPSLAPELSQLIADPTKGL